MGLLAYTMSDRIVASAVKAAADQTALLIGAFIEPLVQDLAQADRLSSETVRKLDTLVAEEFRDRVQILKVWLKDGTLIYNSNKTMVGERLPAQPPRATLHGEVVGFFDKPKAPENSNDQKLQIPLIEIYVPLYKTGSKQLLAVAEFYTSGERIANELRTLRLAAIGIVGVIMIPMMGALFSLVIQANASVEAHQTQLTRKIAETERLAQQNDRLRRASEEVRMEAATSNERLLEQIGQDLHDGPIQLLSLLVLKLSAPQSASKAANEGVADESLPPAELAAKILKEVRDVSTGLVLPELDGLTITETISTAVRDHQLLTGRKVACELGDLPDALTTPAKICIFRLVQESLNNAFHHANGADQTVAAWADDKFVTVAVTNTGDASAEATPQLTRRSKISLGLSGIRRRVEALNGFLDVSVDQVNGTTVIGKLPIILNSKHR